MDACPVAQRCGKCGQRSGVTRAPNGVDRDPLQHCIVPHLVRAGLLRYRKWPVQRLPDAVLRVGIPEIQCAPQMVITGTWACDDPACHAAQHKVDRSLQLIYSSERGAAGSGRLRQTGWVTESPRIHRGGERLEMRLPGQIVVETVEFPCGTEQLCGGLRDLECPRCASPASHELHLSVHPRNLSTLELGKRGRLRYGK